MEYSTYAVSAGGGLFSTLLWLAIAVLTVVAAWKMFVKAGKPGWAILVPIYNLIVLMEIIGKPVWWFLLFCIPIVNIFIWYVVAKGLAKSYGFSSGYTWLCFFLPTIFFLIAGFKSDVVYAGPAYEDGAAK